MRRYILLLTFLCCFILFISGISVAESSEETDREWRETSKGWFTGGNAYNQSTPDSPTLPEIDNIDKEEKRDLVDELVENLKILELLTKNIVIFLIILVCFLWVNKSSKIRLISTK